MAVLVFDGTGAADQFEVTDVQGDTLALVHDGTDSGHVYEAGSTIAEVVARTLLSRARRGIGHDPPDERPRQRRRGRSSGRSHCGARVRICPRGDGRRPAGCAVTFQPRRRPLAARCDEPAPIRRRPACRYERQTSPARAVGDSGASRAGQVCCSASRARRRGADDGCPIWRSAFAFGPATTTRSARPWALSSRSGRAALERDRRARCR